MQSSSRHILIADDNRDARELIRFLLERSGYTVSEAIDGQDALEKIDAHRPDLVLLDLMMPVMDGWTVLERLRSRADPPRIVVLSGYADQSRAMAAGARGFVPKPFRPGELLATCSGALAA